jgi:hypothetical protein
MNTTRKFSLLLCLFAFALAGCGDSATPGAPATPPLPAPTLPNSTTTTTQASAPASSPQANVLYRADWSTGMAGWTGAKQWKVVGSQLASDGTESSPSLATAPYRPTTANYTLEAAIKLLSSPNGYCQAGLLGRGQVQDSGGTVGYLGGLTMYSYNQQPNAAITGNDGTPIQGQQQPFNAASDWHLYAADFRDTQITLKIDGQTVLTVNDNRYLGSGQVGLVSNGCQIQVANFTVAGL